MDELASPDATTDSVGELISQDISLTAKLLQLVNSAFFGAAQPVTNTQEAVQILGFSMVKTLAVSIYVFSRFDPDKMPGFPMERLWKHSLATGMLARKIASSLESERDLVDTAFTAGVLHDIGKLVLGFSLPQLYRMAMDKALTEGIPQHQAETTLIGTTHAEVGGYLLGLWGLPPELVEAVSLHHQPRRRDPEEFSAVTAVHIANFVHERRTPVTEVPLVSPLDEDHVKALNLTSKVRSWIEEAG
jgi:HD-like signal output (HDOD) protein